MDKKKYSNGSSSKSPFSDDNTPISTNDRDYLIKTEDNQVIEPKKTLKKSYIIFLIISILFIIFTIVLNTIHILSPYKKDDIPPTDMDIITLICSYIGYLLIIIHCMLCINIQNIYRIE